MKKKINSLKGVKLAVIGASVAALAATTYFFFGPKGKIHQRHAKAWAIKMKGEVIGRLENAKDVTEDKYHDIIDSVAKGYVKNSKIAKSEVDLLVKDLKQHWKTISKSAKSAGRELKKGATKAVKKIRSSK